MTSPNPVDPTSGATPGAYGEHTPAPYGAVNPAHGYPPPYPVARSTNGMAIASLVTSIVALFSCSLLGAVGVYLAKRAREEIRTKGEDGEGLATAGLVIGWIGVGLGILGILFLVLYFGVLGFAIWGAGTS